MRICASWELWFCASGCVLFQISLVLGGWPANAPHATHHTAISSPSLLYHLSFAFLSLLTISLSLRYRLLSLSQVLKKRAELHAAFARADAKGDGTVHEAEWARIMRATTGVALNWRDLRASVVPESAWLGDRGRIAYGRRAVRGRPARGYSALSFKGEETCGS